VFVPDKSCLIVGTPRSGSSTLAAAISDTGVLGRPHEYFWRMVEDRHAAEDLHVDPPTDENYALYLDAALRFGTTANGVFGAKLFWEHHKDFMRRLALISGYEKLTNAERLWRPFGADVRVTYLTRNCLDAALSLWRAEVTNEWGRAAGVASPPPPDALDVWRVSFFHAELHAAAIGWPNLFRAVGVEPLRISYDDVVGDLSGTVERIAAHTDVQLHASPPSTPLYIRQADEATVRFRTEWTLTTGGCESCA
jgi:LPS sulfotransferase NodH